MYRCASHPSQAVVGICSACLRERLMKLAKANYEQRRSEIVYMPDPSSWGYLRFKRKNSDDVEGIRELDLNSSRITTSKSENYNSSDKKKAARNVRFSGFRSFLGFLRKRACRNNVCVRGRLEDGNAAAPGSIWGPPRFVDTFCDDENPVSFFYKTKRFRAQIDGHALLSWGPCTEKIHVWLFRKGDARKPWRNRGYHKGTVKPLWKISWEVNAFIGFPDKCRSRRIECRMRDMEIKGFKSWL